MEPRTCSTCPSSSDENPFISHEDIHLATQTPIPLIPMEPATLLVHYSAIATDHGYTLPLPQTMAILCLMDSLYPSSQALSCTSHPILLHQFHLFLVSTFFFSACHQECSLVVSNLLSGLKGLIWSSLCLLSMLPIVPSSQTPARSIFPSRSSCFPKCDSSSIHEVTQGQRTKNQHTRTLRERGRNRTW